MSLKRRNIISLLLFIALGFVGCSSTGYSTKSGIIVPKTIRAPASISVEVAPYVPRFVGLLQENGFAVGKTNDPRALDLVFEFNSNPFNLRVSAGLWREGIPILSATATNPGWGTVIARGSVTNSLADSTAQKFTEELKKLITYVRIVEDVQ